MAVVIVLSRGWSCGQVCELLLCNMFTQKIKRAVNACSEDAPYTLEKFRKLVFTSPHGDKACRMMNQASIMITLSEDTHKLLQEAGFDTMKSRKLLKYEDIFYKKLVFGDFFNIDVFRSVITEIKRDVWKTSLWNRLGILLFPIEGKTF